jgi:flagellar hook-length control protein FliK
MRHTSDGVQRITVRLDPPELGRVQVRIDRPTDAPARVEITVEKAETLTLLLRDQTQLQRALDQAGVPTEGRSVTFHIASPEPAPRGEAAPTPMPAPGVAGGGPNGNGSQGAPRNGGQPDRHQSGMPDTSNTEFTPVTPQGRARGGLNIIA